MKIRVKYCGGCNPRYDRRAIAEEIRSKCPQAEVIESHVEDMADLVTVICGCPATCASHDDLQGRLGKIVISSEEESGKIFEALKEICK